MPSIPQTFNPIENRFIRLYVKAMQRDYHLLCNVMDVMDPDGLNVECVVEAAQVARGLVMLHDEFADKINKVSDAGSYRTRKVSTEPSAEELSSLFSLSFFKLMAKRSGVKKDNGWFSGEPATWQTAVASAAAAKSDVLPDKLVGYLKTVQQLFTNHKLLEQPKHGKLPPGMYTFKQYLQAQEEDDPDDDFFGWPDDEE